MEFATYLFILFFLINIILNHVECKSRFKDYKTLKQAQIDISKIIILYIGLMVLAIILFNIWWLCTLYVMLICYIIYGKYNDYKKIRKKLDIKCGFIIGRFQPFHTGHLYVIEKALEVVDKLYICIGSYSECKTKRNPLSGKERMKILNTALYEYIIKGDVVLVPLEDLKGEDNNAADWGEHVFKTLENYTNITPTYTFGGEEIVRNHWYSIDRLDNLSVVEMPKTPISATEIRSKIYNGEDVRDFLPYNEKIANAVIYRIKERECEL